MTPEQLIQLSDEGRLQLYASLILDVYLSVQEVGDATS